MEHEKTSGNGKSFLQDPQKLTLAFGLSTGIAVMAVVALVIVAVRGTNGGTKSSGLAAGTNTAAAADAGAGTATADATLYDPVRIASAIDGLNTSKFQECLDAKKYTQHIDSDINAATTAGVQGTPTTYVNNTEVSGALPYAQLKAAIDAALSGTKGTANIPAVSKDDHVEGAKNPKIYLVEYSDFQCPYCKAFNPTLQQALSEYKDKIALVYRHFPLESIHPYARTLAEGSECANEQGKFWEYHDQVFSS